MPTDWELTALGDLVEFHNRTRIPLSTMERSRRQGPYPYHGAAGVLDHVDDYRFDGLFVLVGEDGSVVDQHGAPVLQLVSGKFWVSNHAHVLKMSTDLDTRWLYYALRCSKIGPHLSGSVQPKLSLGNLKKLMIAVPPPEVRAAIVEQLADLDSKLESNLRVIDLIEQLGAAILRGQIELGADGEPVGDPDHRLGDYLSVLETGSRPKGGVKAQIDGVVSLGAENVQSAGVSTAAKFKYVPEEFAQAMRRGWLQDGDLLVYKDGGKPGNFIPHVSAFGYGFPVPSATINEHVYRVRAVPAVAQGLLYWLLRSPWLDAEMRKRGTGVAIPGLNSTNFRDLPWPKLDNEAVLSLREALDPLLEQLLRLGSQSRVLEDLADRLMRRLVRGDFEKSFESVGS